VVKGHEEGYRLMGRPRNRRIAEEQVQAALQAEAEAGHQAKADEHGEDKYDARESGEGKKVAGMVQRVVSA
jgi:hypothetical protein